MPVPTVLFDVFRSAANFSGKYKDSGLAGLDLAKTFLEIFFPTGTRDIVAEVLQGVDRAFLGQDMSSITALSNSSPGFGVLSHDQAWNSQLEISQIIQRIADNSQFLWSGVKSWLVGVALHSTLLNVYLATSDGSNLPQSQLVMDNFLVTYMKEFDRIKDEFGKKFREPKREVRIHNPGGWAESWWDYNVFGEEIRRDANTPEADVRAEYEGKKKWYLGEVLGFDFEDAKYRIYLMKDNWWQVH